MSSIPLPSTFAAPTTFDPSLTPNDPQTFLNLIAQLQAAPGTGGGTDMLPTFLLELVAVLRMDGATGMGSNNPARPLSLGALVLDAAAAWADGNDADFAAQLRLESAFLTAVRTKLAI